MAELNLKQITDKLNSEFTGNSRKLVFWYDANAEFVDDVDTLELVNASVLHLNQNNQFEIKYILERQDTTSNYLIYAPFPKPDIRENHLSDTIRYSKEFFADRTSLLCLDLGISEKNKPTIQKYITFFNNKDRTQAFYSLEIDNYSSDSIETGLMSVLCKNKAASFEEVVRSLLTDGELEDNKFLSEFDKYSLTDSFWKHCEEFFGYTDSEPSLRKLAMTMFVTYTQKTILSELPNSWKPYVSYKPGNVIAFLDNLMNSVIYEDKFDELSQKMYFDLNAKNVFENMSPDDISDCIVFSGIDKFILKWLIGRLEAEDVDAKLNGRSIPEICAFRSKKHFGSIFKTEYALLENAYYLICPGIYKTSDSLSNMAEDYCKINYKIDQYYRNFYYNYDRLDENSYFENVRDLVENIYTNDYLNKITSNWSQSFVDDNGDSKLTSQLDFFSKYVKYKKERVVVIISDAMRYEVGVQLFNKMQENERADTKLSAMQSLLPSITSVGMAALLPNSSISIDNDLKVLCDNQSCSDLKQREAILQSHSTNSRCVQYDDVKSMKGSDLKALTAGQDIIYVYHNQIDARGDKLSTENEVFDACEEAVNEIVKLIRDFTTKGNVLHFIVTADHGFIYKRDKLSESDKISGIEGASKRYALSDALISVDGVVKIPMSTILRNPDDYRYVLSPKGSDVFKAPGSGLNYVHGGCSPQEMIVPVVEIKTEKGRVNTSNASIDLVSLTNKVTNLNINLDFLQKEPVSDTVKETSYRVYFTDSDGNAISNVNIYHADSRELEATKRVFRLKFTFKNQTYDKKNKYYLVAIDDNTGLETLRREVIMDLAFAGDFGFSI